MNEQELGARWITLEPTSDQRRRVTTQVFAQLEAHDTSLAAEWLSLFRFAPFTTVGLATVSAIAIAAVPFAWFARALM
jgi:hypothetical protein